MNSRSGMSMLSLLTLVSAALVGAHAQAADPEIKVITLCKAGEKTLMAGRMNLQKTNDKGGIYYVPNGKFASLCANSVDEPITSMVYRYGKPGAIDMEEVATPQRKFSVFYEQGGPAFGTNIAWFKKGEFTYQIGAGVGMARGVSVTVHKGDKPIVGLFSDLDDEDHFSNTYGIDFKNPTSPVLNGKEPF
jgi:hypothetical protein